MPQASGASDVLLGRNREQTVLALSLATALFMGFFVLIPVFKTKGRMTAGLEHLPLVIMLIFVVGGVITAGNAYWNGGLVGSWLLVFGPVVAWLWHIFVQGAVFLSEAIVPLGWAVVTGLLVGTVGHIIGRRLRTLAPGDTVEKPSVWLFRLLVGHDPRQLVKWAVRAGGLFIVTAGLMYVTLSGLSLPVAGLSFDELFIPVDIPNNPILTAIIIFGWIGLAMWPAYQNNGLLASWGLLFGPLFGATVTEFVMDTMTGSLMMDSLLSFLAALIIAVILGTAGFLLGKSLRWAVDYGQGTDEQSLGS